MVELLLAISRSSGIYAFMHSAWGWPVTESVHFAGLCLLVGSVGLFDLRMLGLGRGISMSALHQLIPAGVTGFVVSVLSGTMFLMTAPDQYIYNPAFQLKMLFMALAGVNMLFFYGSAANQVYRCSAESRAPRRAMLMAGVSLSCWCLVIIAGRLITYFRPPYHWCLWC